MAPRSRARRPRRRGSPDAPAGPHGRHHEAEARRRGASERRGAVPHGRRTPAGDRVPGSDRGRARGVPPVALREPAGRVHPGLHDPGVAGQPRGAFRPVRRGRPRAGPAGTQAGGSGRRAVQRRIPDARARRQDRLVPGRGRPGARRRGPPGLLAGDHVRRHAPARERGARPRDRDPVPRARRATPGDRVLRVRGQGRTRPHVHQLARGRDPGGDAGAVARGSRRQLARPHPRRRSRRRRTGEHPLRPDRRAVRRRVPDDHGRRPDRLDPRRGGPGPRRAGQSEVLAGRHVRHHRAARGREQPGGRGGALPRPGRADADDHLPGLVERTALHAVHEPADHVDPRLHATGLVRRRRPVRQARAPRRRRARRTRAPSRSASTTPRTG